MPEKTFSSEVEYITRVEGHGNITINVKEGKIEKCEFRVVESPRFFEGMLRGRSIFEAQHITSRICGICACGHTLASIEAAESALGISPSEQTIKLRKLLLDMEILDSHILHIYLLAVPDLLGAKSAIALIKTHKPAVRRALRMKKACNDICDILVGRHVHPISAIAGGFTKLPSKDSLKRILELLKELQADLGPTLDLAAKLKFPQFERDTEYVGLVSEDGEYPLLSGRIGSTDGVRLDKNDYRKATNEFVVQDQTAKFTRLSRDSYMTGALARFNLNYDKLHPKAKKAAARLKLKPKCTNPYLNTAAQVVECVHCAEHAARIVKDFLANGVNYDEQIIVGLNENGKLPVKAGKGVGAVEVPRGILFHCYETDEAGRIVNADCIIPTNQNVNNIQKDLQKLLPEILHKSEKEITLAMEMLVRAYDPCISCSAHFLEVKYVNR